MTDIEIANNVKPKNIIDIAKKLNLTVDDLELYGNDKCKIKYSTIMVEMGLLI